MDPLSGNRRASQLAGRNLRAERASLQARVRRIEARLVVAAGGRSGRVRGYATPAERHAKTLRLKSLRAQGSVRIMVPGEEAP